MTAADVVARQMERSGNTLMLAMEPLDPDEFSAVNANGFSAAWVVGHLACVTDLFSSWFTGKPLFDPRFHAVFNETAVKPPSSAFQPDFYAKADLLLRYRTAGCEALRILRTVTDWDASPPPAAPALLATAGAVWEHLAVHTYWHLGELAGSMPRFFGTYTLNSLPHHFYLPPGEAG
jgi:hypothetical protein